MAETKIVLVTGSSGFIGSHISKKISIKDEVICIDKVSNANNKHCTFIKGDLGNSKTLEKIQRKVDFVFDFGSPSSQRLFEKDPSNLTSNTIRGFINILEFCKNKGVSKLIYPSSGTVYGNSIGSESKRLEPMNHYASVKLFYESIAQAYSNYFSSVGLRIFMGYGPREERKGDIGSPAFLFLRDILAGKQPIIWGDGLQQRDLVYIDDIVDAAINSSFKKTPKFIDVGTGNTTNFIELLNIISKVAGKDIKPVFVNAPAGYQTKTRADPEQFIKLIGRNPVQAEEGIKKFYNYLMETQV
ncbi:MAG: NAD-dependent epimerase/dehydratase family protein [Caldisphaera sp.]